VRKQVRWGGAGMGGLFEVVCISLYIN